MSYNYANDNSVGDVTTSGIRLHIVLISMYVSCYLKLDYPNAYSGLSNGIYSAL